MLTPRLAVSMLGCALALSLAACSQQTTASLYRVHDDPALRAHTQATAQTTSKDPTVGQLWSSFQTSLAAAKSMRIAGTLHIDKKAATVDLSGTCDGSNGRSTITMDNQNLEVTTVSGTYYVKANGAYWRAHGMAPAQIIEIGSRYLATTDATMGQFNVSSILGSLKTTEPITDGMGVIAEKSSLTGRPVYLFSVRTRDGRMTIWVTDTAYTLLKLRFESPDGTDELTFSEWNSPVSYQAPPPAQILKI